MFARTFRPAARAASRPSAQLFTRPAFQSHRLFSATAVNMVVKAGDSIPSVQVWEDSPGNKISLSEKLASGKGLIIGVPAAFSPACSDSHIPGYIASPKLRDAGAVYVVSVNDAFVMKAWQKTLDADKSSGIHFIGDATGEFTKALGLDFDASGLLGNTRGKRYAITVEDGKVKSVVVEPDNIGLTVTAADKVLG